MPEFICKFPFKQAYFLVAIYIFKLRTKAFYVDEDSTLQYVISKRLFETFCINLQQVKYGCRQRNLITVIVLTKAVLNFNAAYKFIISEH